MDKRTLGLLCGLAVLLMLIAALPFVPSLFAQTPAPLGWDVVGKTDGGTFDNAVGVVAPTAVGTATPGLRVDSRGVGNLLEVRDAATPVFAINNGGSITLQQGEIIANVIDGTIALTATTISAAGNLQTTGFGRYAAVSSIAVTQNSTITPTGTYQPLTAAGAVSTGSLVCGTAGNLIVLTNTSANNIVISDTGTIMLSGDLTIGQYDTLTLLSDGTNCLEITFTNN